MVYVYGILSLVAFINVLLTLVSHVRNKKLLSANVDEETPDTYRTSFRKCVIYFFSTYCVAFVTGLLAHAVFVPLKIPGLSIGILLAVYAGAALCLVWSIGSGIKARDIARMASLEESL